MKLTVFIGGALMAILSLASYAQGLPNGPYIETSGMGFAEAQPDMATIVINVSTSAIKSADAKKRADDSVAKYFALVEKMGIDKKDISAANVSTSPQYDYSSAGGSTFKGYVATRTVTVKVRQLDRLNSILDAALDTKLNEISAIQFGVADEAAYKAEARKRAIDDALAQAKFLADGFGVKLGPVYRISYQADSDERRPSPLVMRAKGVAMSSEPYPAGATYTQDTIKFEERVGVVFDIQR